MAPHYYIYRHLLRVLDTLTSLALPRHDNLAPLPTVGNNGIQYTAPGLVSPSHGHLPNNPPYLPPILTPSFLGTGRNPHKNYTNINLARLWNNPLAPSILCNKCNDSAPCTLNPPYPRYDSRTYLGYDTRGQPCNNITPVQPGFHNSKD